MNELTHLPYYPIITLWVYLTALAFPSFAQTLTDLQPRQGHEVGAIPYDPALDSPDFKCCNGVVQQYYAVDGGYRGGRKRLIQLLKTHPLSGQTLTVAKNGYITVRFIVNRDGQTGRFRVLQVDGNYETTSFPQPFVADIVAFVEELDDWRPGQHQGNTYDYYQYLTFKLTDGKVVDLLP
ncbi:hypothetical protein [Parapedobacter tibetensis]|uniref:hypothetical protein n=1 Tax=Parapedobacter tibetensis TaxID=2972951 RepID=UPI00214D75FF|nr:hypothetical protein [Parapedobacter tibetensis]